MLGSRWQKASRAHDPRGLDRLEHRFNPALVVLFACAGPKPPIDPVLRGIEKPLAAFAI
jgi:hypothetical protein